MIGVRLEVEATIITGAKTAIHNLCAAVEKAGLKVSDLVLMSLGAGQLALSKDEKRWVQCLLILEQVQQPSPFLKKTVLLQHQRCL